MIIEPFADAVERIVDSGLVPRWPAGAAVPPMPPMVDVGNGVSMSREALRFFAAAGDEAAARLLAEE